MLTFLIWYLITLVEILIGALFLRNLLALLAFFVAHLTLFLVDSLALLFLLLVADLLVEGLAVHLGQPLAVSGVLDVYLHVVKGLTALTLLQCLTDWDGSWDDFAVSDRDVPTGFLWDGEAVLHFPLLTLGLRNLLADLIVFVYTLFLRDLLADVFWLWFIVAWLYRLVAWLALFPVDCPADFLLVRMTDLLDQVFALLYKFLFALNILLPPALSLNPVSTLSLDVRSALFHFEGPTTTSTKQVSHVACCTFKDFLPCINNCRETRLRHANFWP